MAGESRSALISWSNSLLELDYTKVEQFGTGAAYCQLIDSIYGDVPMHKVKMNARQQYEYLANFKVLQNVFKVKSIDKPIPVDRLINCKMQDNLEFLQWLKKYWDLNFPGGHYDAVARRGGGGGAGGAVGGGGGGQSRPQASTSRASTTSTTTTMASTSSRRPVVGGGAGARVVSGAGGARPGSASAGGGRGSAAGGGGADQLALQQLTSQMDEMKISVEGLEKERDFYFNKLRDIEIIIGARLESEDETMTEVEKEQLLAMQQILYSTEDGFEVPEGEEELPLEDEEETF